MAVMVALAAVVALIVLCVCLIYFPPFQNFAVKKAAGMLSDEMGMEISVGDVLLKWPLKLRVQEFKGSRVQEFKSSRVQDVHGEKLEISGDEIYVEVDLWALFDGKVMVDSLSLCGVDANTGDMIKGMGLKVESRELREESAMLVVKGVEWDMNNGFVDVDDVVLAGTDVELRMNDETDNEDDESDGAVLKVINVKHLGIRSVEAKMDMDTLKVDAYLDKCDMAAVLDLEKGDYKVSSLDVEGLKASVASPDIARALNDIEPGFCTDGLICVDRCDVKGKDLSVVLGAEFRVQGARLELKVNDAAEVVVKDLMVQGAECGVQGEEQGLPVEVSADVSVNVTDINAITKILGSESSESSEGSGSSEGSESSEGGYLQSLLDLPEGSSVSVECKVQGAECRVQSAELDVPGTARVNVDDFSYDLNSGDMAGNVTAKVENFAVLKKMLPKEVANMVNVPKGTTVSVAFGMKDGKVNADRMMLTTPQGTKLTVGKAFFDTETETYDIDADVRNLVVNQFVSLPERTAITGHIKAKGKGFDFFSPASYATATISMADASYGQYRLQNTNLSAVLKRSELDANISVDDENLVGNVSYDGTLSEKNINGQLLISLEKSDLYALKIVESPLEVSMLGVVNVSGENLFKEFKGSRVQGFKSSRVQGFKRSLMVDAGVMGLSVETAEDSILVDEFAMYANSSDEMTQLNMVSGDMDVLIQSPMGYEELIDRYIKVGDVAMQQLKDMKLDVTALKENMPEATVSVHLGDFNPIAQLMNLSGMAYDGIDIDISTSSEIGVSVNADIFGLETESVRLDTIVVDVFEDEEDLNVKGRVTYPEQNGIRPFTAALDGFVAPKESQIRLFYYDEHGEKGVDFGLRAQVADSMLCMDVYPYDPIIGYKQFEVADTNYVNLHRKNRMFADVRMVSKDDSCMVHISADPADDELQMINLNIQNLNMEPLIAVLPFAPQMTGMLAGDVAFVQRIDTTFSVIGNLEVDDFVYESTKIGDVSTMLNYSPTNEGGHTVKASLICNDEEVALIKGEYADSLDARVKLTHLPLDMISAFMEDLPVAFSGGIGGNLALEGPIDGLLVNGFITPEDARVFSKIYSLDFAIDNDTVKVENSKVAFDQLKVFAAGKNPISLRGNVDFSDFDNMNFDVTVVGRGVELVNAPQTRQSELYGKVNGDLFVRLRGDIDEMDVSGSVKVLNTSDINYIMTNTALAMGYRLDDIVTFVDFSLPPDTTAVLQKTFAGLDMNLRLTVEDGAKVKCVFSADGKSYVDVQGGGTLTLVNNSEGVTQLTGRYTINSGEMKYANSVIPLKTFTIQRGSYIEFTGVPMNPTLSLAATERERASVSNSDGSTRMVTFNTGLKISQTLQNLGLEFTIDAPEDLNVQNELAGMTSEEKNKLALTMLATGIYASSANHGSFNTTNALNNFLQGEINNIAGKAINSVLKVDMNLGVENTTRSDGSSHTDYSFKFSKRLFSDRLSVVVGGMINTGGKVSNTNHSGTYIDNVSLEWRLDQSGTQYIRLFHDKDYNNLIEGEITENGGGMVLRKKVDKWSELWKLFQFGKGTLSAVKPQETTTSKPQKANDDNGKTNEDKEKK